MAKQAQAGPGDAQDRSQGTDSAGTPAGASQDGQGRTVGERKKKYLVAPRQPVGAFGTLGLGGVGAAPIPLAVVEQALRNNPDIDLIDTIGTRSNLGLTGVDGGSEGVLVARMTDRQAAELHGRGAGRLLVERDQHLHLLDPMLQRPDLVSSLTPYTGPAAEVAVMVLGKDRTPLAEAEVSLFGGMLPASAITDNNGVARLRLFGDDPRSISGLYVKPRADYWSFYQRDPDIDLTQPNLVALQALSDWPALPGFPGKNSLGWGERAMRLDALPQHLRGQGVKIAIIDSGAATSHGNLNRIRAGFDIINKRSDPGTWNDDTLGHGSHCAGVIAGADPAWGIRGFAPDAEIHVCKLFPGGQISQLIEALEYCIEYQIDVVNMSLGGGAPSEALERQIMRAKQAGVACIVAAGNSGGPVQYPASSPHVLAVTAIGKIGEFPADSYHTETMGADADSQGFFTAKFSCFGPQVGVCAPGVAIVSSVPQNNFAAWDGTSMAAPHITGLAALILAHRPEFQGLARMRSPERVERLFQIIRLSARQVTLSDAARIGNGLPDALAALSLPLVPNQGAGAWQHMFGGVSGEMGNGGRMPAFSGGAPYPFFSPAATSVQPMGFGFQMGTNQRAGW